MKKQLYLLMFSIFLLFFSFSFISSETWNSGLNNSLISYWGFNQNSGNTITDGLGLYDMLSNSSTWLSGINGNSMNFSYANEEFARTTSNITQITGNYTLNGWINLNIRGVDTGQASSCFYKIGANFNDGNENNHMICDYIDADLDYYWLSAPNTITGNVNGVINLFSAGNWEMFSMTWDSSTKTQSMYYQGILNQSQILTNDLPQGELWLAKSSQGQFFFSGKIDEVGLWNRVLNDTEIALLYDGGTGTFNNQINNPAPIVLPITPPTTLSEAIKQVVLAFSNIFPDVDSITTLEAFSIVLTLIFVITIVIFVLLRNSIETAILLSIIVDILLFIFFIFIGYVKIGALLIIASLVIIISLIKSGFSLHKPNQT